MSDERKETLAERMDRDELVDEAIREAVDDAVEHHRAKGQPVVVWKDGRPQWVSAEKRPA